jgi:tRNA pseudouridine55 synthase
MATGVLVVGFGRGTRLLTYVIGSDKRYAATVRLGQRTVTDDADGPVVDRTSAAELDQDRIVAALVRLTGSIQQVPSAVSAIKVAGRRAYARVRAGEQVELAARPVTIFSLSLIGLRRPEPELVDIDIDVRCSSGTYVRALARDLGDDLGVGGHLTALRRTAVGSFTTAEALSLDQLAEREQPVMLDLAQAARRLLPCREVDASEAAVLSHGGPLASAGIEGPYAILDPGGALVAIVADRNGRAWAEAVLAPAGPVHGDLPEQ